MENTQFNPFINYSALTNYDYNEGKSHKSNLEILMLDMSFRIDDGQVMNSPYPLRLLTRETDNGFNALISIKGSGVLRCELGPLGIELIKILLLIKDNMTTLEKEEIARKIEEFLKKWIDEIELYTKNTLEKLGIGKRTHANRVQRFPEYSLQEIYTAKAFGVVYSLSGKKLIMGPQQIGFLFPQGIQFCSVPFIEMEKKYVQKEYQVGRKGLFELQKLIVRGDTRELHKTLLTNSNVVKERFPRFKKGAARIPALPLPTNLPLVKKADPKPLILLNAENYARLSTLQKRTMKNLYRDIVKMMSVELAKNRYVLGKLKNNIPKEQGVWCFYRARQSDDRFHFERLIEKIDLMTDETNGQIVEMIINDLIKFWGLSYRSSTSLALEKYKSIMQSNHEEITKVKSSLENSLITDQKFLSVISKSYFEIKLKELAHRATHLDEIMKQERSGLNQFDQRPLYLVDQTATHLRLFPLMSQFDSNGHLQAIYRDDQSIAKNLICDFLDSDDMQEENSDYLIVNIKVIEELQSILQNSDIKSPFSILELRLPYLRKIEATGCGGSSESEKSDEESSSDEEEINSPPIDRPMPVKILRSLEEMHALVVEESEKLEEEEEPTPSTKTIPGVKQNIQLSLDNEGDLDLFWKNNSLKLMEKVREFGSKHLLQSNPDAPLSWPILDKIKNLAGTSEQLPKAYQSTLKPYQQESHQRIIQLNKAGLSSLLALDMGTGKTIIMAEGIILFIVEGNDGDILIVNPVSTLKQTKQAIKSRIAKGRFECFLGTLLNKDKYIPAEFTTRIESILQFIKQGAKLIVVDEIWNHPIKRERLKEALSLFASLPEGKMNDEKFVGTMSQRDALIPIMKIIGKEIGGWRFHSEELQEVFITRLVEELFKLIHSEDQSSKDFNEDQQLLYEAFEKAFTAYEQGNFDRCLQKFLSALEKHAWLELSTYKAQKLLLNAIGKILMIDPNLMLNELNHEAIDLPAFEQLANFPFDRKSFITMRKKDDKLEVNKRPFPRFIFTTYTALTKPNLTTQFVSNGNIVKAYFDEAQYVHTSTTQGFQKIQNIIQQLEKKNPEFNVTLCTGTPLENSFVEVWNLLSLANPNQFSLATLKSLNTHLERAKRAYNKNIDSVENLNPVIQAFMHFSSFQQVIAPLVQRVSKSDPLIREQWGGRMPEKCVRTIKAIDIPNFNISEGVQNRIDKNEKKFGKFQLQTLELKNRLEKLLIHYKLEKVKFNQEEAGIDALFEDSTLNGILNDINSCPSKEIDQILSQSPINNALINCSEFNKALAKGQDIVIFVHYHAHTQILEALLKAKFKDNLPGIKTYNGRQNKKERDDTVDWFNNETNKSPNGRVLIISLKAGGVGLNFPKAMKSFFLTGSWNPQLIYQAEDRIVRAGNIGERKIYHFNFGTATETHVASIVCEKKKAWEQFLLSSGSDILERFQQFLDILKLENAHNEFLKTHNVKKVREIIKKALSLSEKSLAYVLSQYNKKFHKIYPRLAMAHEHPPQNRRIPKRKTREGSLRSKQTPLKIRRVENSPNRPTSTISLAGCNRRVSNKK